MKIKSWTISTSCGIRCFEFLLITAITLSYGVPTFGGWSDTTPSPINIDQNPGSVDPHANSGGRRIVRIENTTIVLCPHNSGEDRTFRSSDNGRSWQEIDRNGTHSGVLIAGPNRFIYHFYLEGSSLYMIKFQYNQIPPPPTIIYSHPNLSLTATGVYRAVNATVDAGGTIYITTHWGEPDDLYLFRSETGGIQWSGPFQISAGHGPWFYPHLEVTESGRLVATYRNFNYNNQIWLVGSQNKGQSWTRKLIGDEETNNPSLLTVGENGIFVFAQSSERSHTGLVFNFSLDSGASWSGWRVIDSTCGYGDPSPALGSDGRSIYVAYRSSSGTGITVGSCGDRSRARMAMSPDFGASWQFVDNFYDAERTGTRFQIRYQTWWNYGGPLEWIWMQYEDDGLQRPIYYDVNTDVQIFNIQSNYDPSPRQSTMGFLPILGPLLLNDTLGGHRLPE